MLPPQQAFSIACAVTSTAISFMVVLTGVIFRSMMSSVFMRTIVTIAFCDFCGNFMFSLGFPSAGALCSAQGFIGYVFTRASWFFTVCLSLQLCSLAIYGRIVVSEVWLHVCSWSLTLFLSLIPFAGGFDPGADDGAAGNVWCFIANGDRHDAYTVRTFSAYILVFLVVPLMSSLAILVLLSAAVIYNVTCHVDKFGNSSGKRIRSLVFAMQLYPLALIATWIPTIFIILYFEPNPPIRIGAFVNAVSSLYGTFLGIAFFANSREARQRWRNLFITGADQQSSLNIELDEDLATTIEEQVRLSRISEARMSERQSAQLRDTKVSAGLSNDIISNTINSKGKRSGTGNGYGHGNSNGANFGLQSSDVEVQTAVNNNLHVRECGIQSL